MRHHPQQAQRRRLPDAIAAIATLSVLGGFLELIAGLVESS